ncbi:MAG: DUF4386 domain-containing protein [Acidobacteriota bacterium]
MEPSNRTARLAGWWYLACALTAPFSLIYVPSTLIQHDDPAATIKNLLASESLFRWSLFTGLLSTVAFMIAVLMLYRLLAPVSRALGLAMVGLALITVPISVLDAIHGVLTLNLLHGAKLLSGVDVALRQSMALVFVALGGPIVAVSELFWGLWLFPLGALVIRSRFLPRWLGAVLLVNGLAYTAVSFAAIVEPAYLATMNRLATIPEFGELVFILWLLIRGIRVEAPVPGVASSAG